MKQGLIFFSPRTLRAKIILSSAIAATIPTLAIILFLSKYFIGEMRDALEMKTKSQANLIASNMRLPLDFDDKSVADQVAVNAQKDEDLIYILVFKHNGSCMIEIGQKFAQRVPRYKTTQQIVIFDEENMLNIAQPVTFNKKHYGVVQMGFSLNRLRHASNRVQFSVFLAGLVLAVFVTIVLTFLVGSALVKSVKKMTEVARSLASGNLRYK